MQSTIKLPFTCLKLIFVIILNKMSVPLSTSVPVGPHPQVITCPSCNAHIKTEMRYETTSRTHLNALLLCCFCCWLCACLPYCMNSCRNGNHYCPNCKAFLGTYQS